MDLTGKWTEKGPNHSRDYEFKDKGNFHRHGTSYWKEFNMTTEEEVEGTYNMKPEKGDQVLTIGLGKGKMEIYVLREGKCKVAGKEQECLGLFNHNTFRTLVTPQHKIVFELDQDHAVARVKDSAGNVTLEGLVLTKQ